MLKKPFVIILALTFFWLPQLALAQKTPAFKVPILMYHYIGQNPTPANKIRAGLTVSTANFEEQLKLLKNNHSESVFLNQLENTFNQPTAQQSKLVVLTFDDGYRDFYTNAFPLLKKYQTRAVVFVITGVVDTNAYLTWSQIKEMESSGLVEFESHTVSHPELPKLPADKITNELALSKKTLETKLNKKINFLAYPYGKNNTAVQNIAKKTGYLAGFTTKYGWTEKLNLITPRVRVSGSETLQQFAAALNLKTNK